MIILNRGFENYFQKPDGGCFSSSVVSSISTTQRAEESSKLPDCVTPTTEVEAFKEMSVDQTTEVENEAISINSGNDDYDGENQYIGSTDNINEVSALEFISSNTSILSSGSGGLLFSRSSNESGGSETSHSTYSSGDLAGVFSNTSIQSRADINLPLGSEYHHTIESMMEMGFSRENVEKAMAVSINNPERALEYLINGIAETSDSFSTTAAVARDSVLLKYHTDANYDDKNCSNTRESPFIGDDGGNHMTSNRINSKSKICKYQESGYSGRPRTGESRNATLCIVVGLNRNDNIFNVKP